jgi:hypothetical protein
MLNIFEYLIINILFLVTNYLQRYHVHLCLVEKYYFLNIHEKYHKYKHRILLPSINPQLHLSQVIKQFLKLPLYVKEPNPILLQL